MDFRILGPLEVLANGRPLALGGAKPRAVLAVLLLHVNETVSVDSLIDALWGESAPNGAVQSVRVHISRLRKVLENGRAEGDPPSVLVTTSGGYELRVGDGNLDLSRFEGLFAEGQRALAEERPERAAELLSEALALWRGPALADLAFEPFAQAEAARLDELRVAAFEDRIEADLALGRHAAVASELEPLIAAHPLRERLRRLQMLALYRSGRQAEALEAYRSARRTLVDEIGVEPGTELRELHEAILRQDPALEAPVAAAEPPATPPAAVEPPGPEPRAGRRAPEDRPGAARARRDRRGCRTRRGRRPLRAATRPTRRSRRTRSAAGPRKRRAAIARSRSAAGPDRRRQIAESVWVANTLDDTVSRIDVESGQVATIDVGGEPAGIATGAGFAWVADATEGTVDQLDPGREPDRRLARGRQRSARRGGGVRGGLGAGGGRRRGRANRPRQRRGRPSGFPWARGRPRSRPAPDRYGSPTRRPGPWSASSRTRAGSSEAIGVGNGPGSVAFGEGAVWVANRVDGTVSRIDPETERGHQHGRGRRRPRARSRSARVGSGWRMPATARCRDSRRIPAEVEETIEVGGSPSGLTVASGAVWASVLASTESHRGGALRSPRCRPETCSANASIRPPRTSATRTVASLAYDGLTAYRRVGGAAGSTLVANLATEIPEPEDDGLTYVFELRPDLRFSDGTEVEPEDFRSSIERMLRINARSRSAPHVPLPGHSRRPRLQSTRRAPAISPTGSRSTPRSARSRST